MSSRTELNAVYKISVVLFIAGILCYGFFAFSSPVPERPIRLMFKTAAGNVLFDHKTHFDVSPDSYGLACSDCHHDLEDDSDVSEISSCGECHEPESENMLKRADAFHQQCINCHKDFGAGPQKCASCHVM